MEDIQKKLIEFVLANWDTIAAVGVLGTGLLLTWLKKQAAEKGLGVVVTTIESFKNSPPPVGDEYEVKKILVQKSLQLLKNRIATVSGYDKTTGKAKTPEAKAIDKQVKLIDQK